MTSIYLVSQNGQKIIGEFKNHVGATININDTNAYELSFEIEANDDTFVLEQQSRLLTQFNGEWYEFIVQEVEVFYGRYKYLSIKAYPTHDDLKVIHLLQPFSLPTGTIMSIVDYILYDSSWKRGNITYTANQRAFSTDHIKSAYDLLGEVANLIGHELRFRIDVDEEANFITRYVDFIIDDKELSGKELKFERDLVKLVKHINYSEVFTQLHVLGPEADNQPQRPTVTVEDKVAYDFFNRNGKHVSDVYEPQITANLTGYALTEKLKVLGTNELKKRNKEALEWQIEIARLDSQPGYEHESISMYQWVLIRNIYEGTLYKARISGLSGELDNPKMAVATFTRIEKVGDL
ncbi:hypothetical protein ERX37_05440 [Macrococcus hajekii]|uniref:Tail spike domain-containing protein n=1 Tax=Macrococcus hajekii TaxID=198482 RepID=A0A4R6BNS5_9STAP|nr:phage tail spike protein [Macrococcus hajekii]TDM03529.1 hypothetical protein ERX37_05440 [Macrococcus hajekii]GGA99571.1 hypothetical protein GCM10007190_04540 [Macrococcus hajekii]